MDSGEVWPAHQIPGVVSEEGDREMHVFVANIIIVHAQYVVYLHITRFFHSSICPLPSHSTSFRN